MCLFCYFTDLDTGEKVRLACWRGAGECYAPRKCTIDFAKVRTSPAGAALWQQTCTVLLTGSTRSRCKLELLKIASHKFIHQLNRI